MKPFNELKITAGNIIETARAGVFGPAGAFHSNHYLRHTARRLEHLASLRIPVAGMSVLETGAGIGDHSHYYIDRGCRITITDARQANLKYLKKRYPDHDVRRLDLEHPTRIDNSPFDVLHCYGLLYHLCDPEQALVFLSQNTRKHLFLETCVSFGEEDEPHIIREARGKPTQAYSGTGCRPTRAYIFKRLQALFEFVYVPLTQPNHEEFPLVWTAPQKHQAYLQRAVFISSRTKLENDLLTTSLPATQIRHE